MFKNKSTCLARKFVKNLKSDIWVNTKKLPSEITKNFIYLTRRGTVLKKKSGPKDFCRNRSIICEFSHSRYAVENPNFRRLRQNLKKLSPIWATPREGIIPDLRWITGKAILSTLPDLFTEISVFTEIQRKDSLTLRRPMRRKLVFRRFQGVGVEFF